MPDCKPITSNRSIIINKKDKSAFLFSCLALLAGVLPLIDSETGPLIFFWPPVLLCWLYRYLNKEISFLGQSND